MSKWCKILRKSTKTAQKKATSANGAPFTCPEFLRRRSLCQPHPPCLRLNSLVWNSSVVKLFVPQAETWTNLPDVLKTWLRALHCLIFVKVLCDRTSAPRLPYCSATHWGSIARVEAVTLVHSQSTSVVVHYVRTTIQCGGAKYSGYSSKSTNTAM